MDFSYLYYTWLMEYAMGTWHASTNIHKKPMVCCRFDMIRSWPRVLDCLDPCSISNCRRRPQKLNALHGMEATLSLRPIFPHVLFTGTLLQSNMASWKNPSVQLPTTPPVKTLAPGWYQKIAGERMLLPYGMPISKETFSRPLWRFPQIWGAPTWIVYCGKSYDNGWFRGTPISGTPHMYSFTWR